MFSQMKREDTGDTNEHADQLLNVENEWIQTYFTTKTKLRSGWRKDVTLLNM